MKKTGRVVAELSKEGMEERAGDNSERSERRVGDGPQSIDDGDGGGGGEEGVSRREDKR